MSIVSVDMATAVGDLLLRRQQLLEHGLAARQLGLDAHDRVDVDGVGVELADALDARPLVGDAGVEVGELVGDVLGELVVGQHVAGVLEHAAHGAQLRRRDGHDERGPRRASSSSSVGAA